MSDDNDHASVPEDGAISEGDDPGHSLPENDLNYPTLTFDDGDIAEDGTFDLSTATDHDEMAEIAEDLAGALASHDLGVASPEGFVAFGVGPQHVGVTFDPDDDNRGDLEVTFRLSAKAMLIADDERNEVGSRGDQGFVPLSMLTDDRDHYRCYNWIDDPEDPD